MQTSDRIFRFFSSNIDSFLLTVWGFVSFLANLIAIFTNSRVSAIQSWTGGEWGTPQPSRGGSGG